MVSEQERPIMFVCPECGFLIEDADFNDVMRGICAECQQKVYDPDEEYPDDYIVLDE